MIKKASIMLAVILLAPSVHAERIGRIMQISGPVERASVNTGMRYSIRYETVINSGEKIKTGPGARTEVLLDNGSSILLRERSQVYFIGLRREKKDSPTRLICRYGKVRITTKKTFDDRTMIVTTPTAIISLVLADFSVIASDQETRLLVHRSKLGVESTSDKIRTAYIVRSGEEIRICKNRAPEKPVYLHPRVITWWFDHYSVVENHSRIVKRPMDHKLIDWVLREREF